MGYMLIINYFILLSFLLGPKYVVCSFDQAVQKVAYDVKMQNPELYEWVVKFVKYRK